MVVQKIVKGQDVKSVEKLLDAAEKVQLQESNWTEADHSLPVVRFSILHDGDNIYLKYWVNEQATLARQTEDFGQIWTDSCVEFFLSFGEGHYNMEFNCIGHALTSYRVERRSPEHAARELLSRVERYTSLGKENFDEKHLDEWSIMLKIPKELLFKKDFEGLDGVKATANFFKCGDHLSEPHFMSWSPIKDGALDFHRRECFRAIEFGR